MGHRFEVNLEVDLGEKEEAAIREEIQQVVMRHVARLDFTEKSRPVIIPLDGGRFGGGHTQGIWAANLDEERFRSLLGDR